MEHSSEVVPNISRSNNNSSAINDILPYFSAFVQHISDDDSNDVSPYLSDEDHTPLILEECNADMAESSVQKSTDKDHYYNEGHGIRISRNMCNDSVL